MSSAFGFNNKFATQLITNNLVVPTRFFKFYRQVGLDDTQLLILLHLLADKSDKSLDYYCEELSTNMSASKASINKSLALLIERNFLTIDGKLQMDKLLMEMDKCWQKDNENELGTTAYDETSSLYTIFEQEFGRLLTPMEGDQITEWIEKDKFDYSLIKGSLKRSVLRGVLNFKYVDSILREWRKKNFKSINEVIAYENSPGIKEKKFKSNDKQKEKSKNSNKYRDIYMS